MAATLSRGGLGGGTGGQLPAPGYACLSFAHGPTPGFSLFNVQDRRKLARGEQWAPVLAVLPTPSIY